MKQTYRISFLLIILPFISGCISVTATAYRTVPQPPPPAITLTTGAEAATFLTTSTESLHTIKAAGTLTLYDQGEEVLSLPVVLMYHAPNSVYLRGYKPLAPNIFTVISKKDTFWLYVPEEKMIATGFHTALMSNQDYDVNIIPEFLLPALFAQPVPQAAESTLKTIEGKPTLSVSTPIQGVSTLERTALFEGAYYDVPSEVYWKKGFRFFEINRTDFTHTTLPTFRIAKEISVRNLVRGGSMHLSLKEIEVNVPVDEKAFEFYFPNGVDVETVK